MHVTIAARDLYPDPGSGGTGRYVYETARRLADRGHRVSVITRRRGEVPHREELAGVDVYRYDLAVADRALPAILADLPRALREVSDHLAVVRAGGQPDVLSFQGPVTALLVDLLVADEVPRSCTFHSPWPTEYRLERENDPSTSALRRRLNVRARRSFEARVLRRSDHVVTLSEYMRRQLDRVYGAPDVPTSVVPGGVDLATYTPSATPPEAMADADPAFLTVRRLAERMGHDLLLEAFADVRERHPGARLFVAGDGPLRADLERTAAALGIADRTTFMGDVPDEDLPGVYAGADLFVLPTRRLEGFGLATLEALAAGTPVLGTPVGGTVEILERLADREAVPASPLAAEASAPALAEGMDAWASLDADRRERAGAACRRYVEERFTWERCVDDLVAEYETLARRSPAAASHGYE